MIIEDISEKDIEQALSIYNYYVKNTAITFDYNIQTIDDFKAKVKEISKKYPYLVAKENNKVVGYAYAGPFVGRDAYNHSCELTIYLDNKEKGRGVGKKLYSKMEQILRQMGIMNLYSCIAYPDKDDEYLTSNSRDFHKHLGFTQVGYFNKCGYKFNRFYNMVWMEKIIKNPKDKVKVIRYIDLKNLNK